MLNLLIAKNRSRKELCERLSSDGYPPEVAAEAVEYAEAYHYVDDLRFAVTFLRSKQEEESSRRLAMRLGEKGISRAFRLRFFAIRRLSTLFFARGSSIS